MSLVKQKLHNPLKSIALKATNQLESPKALWWSNSVRPFLARVTPPLMIIMMCSLSAWRQIVTPSIPGDNVPQMINILAPTGRAAGVLAMNIHESEWLISPSRHLPEKDEFPDKTGRETNKSSLVKAKINFGTAEYNKLNRPFKLCHKLLSGLLLILVLSPWHNWNALCHPALATRIRAFLIWCARVGLLSSARDPNRC